MVKVHHFAVRQGQMRCLFLFLLINVASLAMSGGNLLSASAADDSWRARIPAPLLGPYIIDPETLIELDKSAPDCAAAGRLNFQCLVFQDDRSKTAEDLASNPFTLPVFQLVQKTVLKDLRSLADHEEFGGASAASLRDGFLTYAGARIELVGVINRMDRQFNRDTVPNRGERLECGEISAIYRFAYEGNLSSEATGEPRYKSRLPVTMNIVFPARPWSKEVTCQDVAKRWLEYTRSRQNGTDPALLLKQALLVASSLKPKDIDRIELNMQGSRVPAQADKTDFGTLGTYIIRVFRWAPDPKGGLGRWKPSYLSNQIDRSRLLRKLPDENTCDEEKDRKITRTELVSYLLSMDTSENGSNAIGDIDNGLLNIPQRFLACRAISISPGGASRSGNQPFWKATSPAEQIITDDEIDAALTRYKKLFSLGYIGSADEFRTRLNEASCSGCHQTRAIAGFHFPGEDRPGAAPVNAVYLPGSPHFFGDQLRRMEILEAIAGGKTLKFPALAASYAGRPLNRFKALRPDSVPAASADEKMQLIGGWGGTCLTGPRKATEVRDWGCVGDLKCTAVFKSANHPRIGICLNPDQVQIGDPMQFGTVVSESFGNDLYKRDQPAIPDQPGEQRDTRIETDKVKPPAPPDNSYVAAHQEFYEGEGGLDRRPAETAEQHAIRVRDQETGGFPAGALRLSECVGLFPEATCGLLASSGFNACLTEVGDGKRTPDNCFGIYTSYSGVRACNAANPCRDDYICLRPMGYTAENAKSEFGARAARREAARNSPAETEKNRKRLGITFFGEQMPDTAWLGRKDGKGDRRGLCIPPYFVFQFKADGHRVPKASPAPSAGH